MSSFSVCGPMRPEIKKQIERYELVEKKWNSSSEWENLRKRYGKLELEPNTAPLEQGQTRNTSGDMKSFAYRMLDEIGHQVLGKPFDPALPITGSQYKRVVNRLSRLSREIGKGKLSWWETIYKPRKALANRYPEISYFLNTLSKVSNYERGQNVAYATGVDKVSKHLTAELLDVEKMSVPGKAGYKIARKFGKQDPHLANIDSLWEALLIARYEGDTKKLREVNQTLGTVVSKHADGVIEKLLKYVEKGEDTYIKDGKEVKISANLLRAGDEMRNFFNTMGNVTIRGLRESLNSVGIAFFRTDKPTKADLATELGKKFLYTKSLLEQTIEGIQEKIDNNSPEGIIKARREGVPFKGYFPHYLITEYGKVRDLVNKAQNGRDKKHPRRESDKIDLLNAKGTGLNDIIQNFGKSNTLIRSRGRLWDEGLDNAWQKNPIGVMKRYAEDTIAFNKIHHVKSAYLRLIQNIKPVSEDPRFYENMTKYINDMYNVASRGYIDRDPGINNMVRAITSAEFASKLGLGVASAARNFLSANHYLAAVGYNTWGKAMKQYHTDKDLAGVINNIESEQGFKFKDANIAAVTEGLLPSTGVDRNSIEYNEYTEEIRYRRNGKWQSIDKKMSKVAGKLAWFHAVGENAIRKNMFRTTWLMTYNAMKESPEFALSRAGGEKELHTIATNAALIAVNTYAYEYAAFGKAPIIGGTSRDFGAAGQVLGQFMHYPMSFLNQQFHMLRSAGESVAAGDYRSPEVKASIRYAGVYAFVNLLSGVVNLDLTHMFENDTAERARDFVTFLSASTDEEAEKAFHGSGLATQVFGGPFLSDLIFYGNYFGMYRMPENDFAQLVFGYYDVHNKSDKEKSERLLGHINVEMGKVVHKYIPSVTSNNTEEIGRHMLGLYPRKWTREFYWKYGVGKYFGKKMSKVSKRGLSYSRPKKRRGRSAFTKSKQELASLYKAMGI